MLFSGFEFNANLDAIQHTGVFVLFSGFDFNSLTHIRVPAGTKLVLFGRYVLNFYFGIVQ